MSNTTALIIILPPNYAFSDYASHLFLCHCYTSMLMFSFLLFEIKTNVSPPNTEHSIHPPPCQDPWDLEFLPDNGYKIQIVKGVYQVGKAKQSLLRVLSTGLQKSRGSSIPG